MTKTYTQHFMLLLLALTVFATGCSKSKHSRDRNVNRTNYQGHNPNNNYNNLTPQQRQCVENARRRPNVNVEQECGLPMAMNPNYDNNPNFNGQGNGQGNGQPVEFRKPIPESGPTDGRVVGQRICNEECHVTCHRVERDECGRIKKVKRHSRCDDDDYEEPATRKVIIVQNGPVMQGPGQGPVAQVPGLPPMVKGPNGGWVPAPGYEMPGPTQAPPQYEAPAPPPPPPASSCVGQPVPCYTRVPMLPPPVPRPPAPRPPASAPCDVKQGPCDGTQTPEGIPYEGKVAAKGTELGDPSQSPSGGSQLPPEGQCKGGQCPGGGDAGQLPPSEAQGHARTADEILTVRWIDYVDTQYHFAASAEQLAMAQSLDWSIYQGQASQAKLVRDADYNQSPESTSQASDYKVSSNVTGATLRIPPTRNGKVKGGRRLCEELQDHNLAPCLVIEKDSLSGTAQFRVYFMGLRFDAYQAQNYFRVDVPGAESAAQQAFGQMNDGFYVFAHQPLENTDDNNQENIIDLRDLDPAATSPAPEGKIAPGEEIPPTVPPSAGDPAKSQQLPPFSRKTPFDNKGPGYDGVDPIFNEDGTPAEGVDAACKHQQKVWDSHPSRSNSTRPVCPGDGS